MACGSASVKSRDQGWVCWVVVVVVVDDVTGGGITVVVCSVVVVLVVLSEPQPATKAVPLNSAATTKD
jgi:hypothetical protein